MPGGWQFVVPALAGDALPAWQPQPPPNQSVATWAVQGCANASTLQLVVTDTCTTCDAPQVNLNAASFSLLAPLDQGIINGLELRQVVCAPAGNVSVMVDEWRVSSGGWIRLILSNVAGPGIKSIELRQSPLATSDTLNLAMLVWRPMTNTYGATFELSGIPTPPLDLRITAMDGQQLIARDILTDSNATNSWVDTRVQFKLARDGSSTGTAATTPTLPPITPTPTTEESANGSLAPAAQTQPNPVVNALLGSNSSAAAPTGTATSPGPTPTVNAFDTPDGQLDDDGAILCNYTLLDVLSAHGQFSIWRALIHSAGGCGGAGLVSMNHAPRAWTRSQSPWN